MARELGQPTPTYQEQHSGRTRMRDDPRPRWAPHSKNASTAHPMQPTGHAIVLAHLMAQFTAANRRPIAATAGAQRRPVISISH